MIRNGRVDAEPVRKHLKRMRNKGMSLSLITKETGVSMSTVRGLLEGKTCEGVKPWRTVSVESARRIMATAASPPRVDKVDSTGTKRRIRALIAIGWSKSELSSRIGFSTVRGLSRILSSDSCTDSIRKTVSDLYESLWDVHPPCRSRQERINYIRARMFAAREGWAPPMAWDDELLDDPSGSPDGVLSLRQTISNMRKQGFEIHRSTLVREAAA